MEQDNGNGSGNRLQNPTGFGHMTRTFPLRILHGNVTVAGSRLQHNLSIDFLITHFVLHNASATLCWLQVGMKKEDWRQYGYPVI